MEAKEKPEVLEAMRKEKEAHDKKIKDAQSVPFLFNEIFLGSSIQLFSPVHPLFLPLILYCQLFFSQITHSSLFFKSLIRHFFDFFRIGQILVLVAIYLSIDVFQDSAGRGEQVHVRSRTSWVPEELWSQGQTRPVDCQSRWAPGHHPPVRSSLWCVIFFCFCFFAFKFAGISLISFSLPLLPVSFFPGFKARSSLISECRVLLALVSPFLICSRRFVLSDIL